MSEDTTQPNTSEQPPVESIGFNPRMRVKYIIENIKKIRFLKSQGKSDVEVSEKLGDFVKNYPHLFSAAVDPNFDPKELNLQLGLLMEMSKGMSMHQASVIAGQSAFNNFAKPQVNSIPPSDTPSTNPVSVNIAPQ
jgi:hypothetical protein